MKAEAIARVALAWHAADEQRLRAVGVLRKAVERNPTDYCSPERKALEAAKKVERAARRDLKKVCAGPKPITVKAKEVTVLEILPAA